MSVEILSSGASELIRSLSWSVDHLRSIRL